MVTVGPMVALLCFLSTSGHFLILTLGHLGWSVPRPRFGRTGSRAVELPPLLAEQSTVQMGPRRDDHIGCYGIDRYEIAKWLIDNSNGISDCSDF